MSPPPPTPPKNFFFTYPDLYSDACMYALLFIEGYLYLKVDFNWPMLLEVWLNTIKRFVSDKKKTSTKFFSLFFLEMIWLTETFWLSPAVHSIIWHQNVEGLFSFFSSYNQDWTKVCLNFKYWKSLRPN